MVIENKTQVARALLCGHGTLLCELAEAAPGRCGGTATANPKRPMEVHPKRACVCTKYIAKSTRGEGLPCHIYMASSLPALNLI